MCFTEKKFKKKNFKHNEQKGLNYLEINFNKADKYYLYFLD